MGKLTVIAVSAILVCGIAIIAGWGRQWIILPLIFVVLVVVFAAFRAIGKTLEKHPELALWDGTELLAYRKLEMAAKGQPLLPPKGPLILDHGQISLSPPASEASGDATQTEPE